METHSMVIDSVENLPDYICCKMCLGELTNANKTFNLVACKQCSLIFFKKNLKTFDINNYYSTLYNNLSTYNNFSEQLALLKNKVQPRLGFDKSWVLKKLLAKYPKSVCEVGCGIGMVGNYIQSKNISYIGFEPAVQIAEAANAVGVNVKNGTTDSLRNYKQSFDAVIAFEVIEHIDDLKIAFENIYHALKPYGRFGFTVPNYNKRFNFSLKNDELYQSGPPLHINFFTINSIRSVSQIAGFEVEYIKERSFPQKQNTFGKNIRLLLLMAFGKFRGSTIYCILKKI